MTVNELIAELQKLPPETRVVVSGYEDGYDDISRLRIHFHHANAKTQNRMKGAGRVKNQVNRPCFFLGVDVTRNEPCLSARKKCDR